MVKRHFIKTFTAALSATLLLVGCTEAQQDLAEDLANKAVDAAVEELQNSLEEAATESPDSSVESGMTNVSGETWVSFYAGDELISIPGYSDSLSVVVNNNETFFSEEDLVGSEYFTLSEMDELGRCGVANAIVSSDTLADEERGSIGMIKPSGWHTVRYDDLISDKYLYNRCHLIMFALIGSESNVEENLITGTRAFNADTDEGMLHYENIVLNYVKENKNEKVRYRVTPIFDGDDLVARGVLMEAESIDSDNLEFCVFVYNVQPGITIDYATGDSWES